MYGFPYVRHRTSKYRAQVELMSIRCSRMHFWAWINSFGIQNPGRERHTCLNEGRSDKEIEPG